MSFPKFSDFPAEIQDCIWDFVVQQPAIHFFEPVRGPNTYATAIENGRPRLRKKYSLKLDRRSGYYQRADLARTCRGARDAINRFRKRTADPWIVTDETGRDRALLIDSEVDVICLKPRRRNYAPSSDLLRPSGYRAKVRNLALEYPGDLFSTPPAERHCPFCGSKDVGKDGDPSSWARIVSRSTQCDLIQEVITKYENLEKLYLVVDGLPQPRDVSPASPPQLVRYGTTAPSTGQREVFVARGGAYAEPVSYMTSLERSYTSMGVVPLRRAARAASDQRRREIRAQMDHIFYALYSAVDPDVESKENQVYREGEGSAWTLEHEELGPWKEETRSIEFRVLAGETSD
ncbi:hypothetical protein NKR19_g3066 [Coniochaeta hoffmannii]|uniref:2EXR domain-containing protein n=1 Tax=Coniochaeta hoffmannii TaxID=91930 RepID=A0AA38RXN7_9PEZI|nr:hypothetical protein NKR19_g3066 [Coniochaeta hoffmannii]